MVRRNYHLWRCNAASVISDARFLSQLTRAQGHYSGGLFLCEHRWKTACLSPANGSNGSSSFQRWAIYIQPSTRRKRCAGGAVRASATSRENHEREQRCRRQKANHSDEVGCLFKFLASRDFPRRDASRFPREFGLLTMRFVIFHRAGRE